VKGRRTTRPNGQAPAGDTFLEVPRATHRRNAFLLGITIFSVSAGALWITYRVATAAMLGHHQRLLKGLTQVAAGELDPAGLQQLRRGDQTGSPLYRRLSQPLVALRGKVPEIFYAYTLAPSPAGLRFGLDSSYFVRNPGDETEVASVGELYSDAPPAALRAMRSGSAEASDPYTDRWGSFVSAYAPVRDGAGKTVALLGLDVRTQELKEHQLPLRLTVLLALLVTGGLATLAALDNYRSMRAQTRALREQQRARLLAEEAAKAAATADRAKSDFIATLSHEIRTPLNGVLGMTDLVLATPLNVQQRECLDTVKSSGHTLLAVLNDILDFSKIESGKLTIEPQTFPLRPLLEGVLDLYAGTARSQELELVLWVAPAVPEVIHTDPTRLRQILMNLISNAVKFTTSGSIVLKVDPEPAGADAVANAGAPALLRFQVQDTGPGIPPERLPVLFQPFSQADTSTTRVHGGTGLGLVISRRLAEALGGTITVSSVVGSGSCFRVELPLAAPAATPAANATTSAAPECLRGRRLLIALGDPANRSMVEESARLWGLEPRCAGSTDELLEELNRGPLDAVLLGTSLAGLTPENDAASLARRIHHHPAQGSAAVLLYRWLGEPLAESSESAFHAVLSKPVKLGPLQQALESAFRPAEAALEGVSGPGEAPQEGPPVESTQERRAEAGTLAERCPMRVLVAEDNAVNRRVVELLLKRLGYTVTFALDGEEAVQQQEELQPDLILMDLHMPRLDGLEATRRIRAACGDAIHPWIIALTADAAPATCRAALVDGINDYLTKPVGADALSSALRHAYETMQASAPREA
jgi:signal transduction histidine kinase/CheY-like chemotaxis protein